MTGFNLSPQGLLQGACFIASPNHDPRPSEVVIDLIVIHNISLPPNEYGGDGVIQLFTNCLNPDEHPYYLEIYQRKVSAHFFIRRDGELLQFVPCTERAWHAGVSNWQGRDNCNDFSIGIEIEGSDFEAFEDAQYFTLRQLVDALKCAFPITSIAGHSDIAPGRKTDPGAFFEWDKLQP
jgi:AmpD protein